MQLGGSYAPYQVLTTECKCPLKHRTGGVSVNDLLLLREGGVGVFLWIGVGRIMGGALVAAVLGMGLRPRIINFAAVVFSNRKIGLHAGELAEWSRHQNARERLEDVPSKIVRWLKVTSDSLVGAKPALPSGFYNRLADN